PGEKGDGSLFPTSVRKKKTPVPFFKWDRTSKEGTSRPKARTGSVKLLSLSGGRRSDLLPFAEVHKGRTYGREAAYVDIARRLVGRARVGGDSVGPGFGAGGGGRRPHLHQGRRADPPGEVPGVSPAEQHGANVAPHLRGRAAVGAGDPAARRIAADAAVASRQDGRDSAVQERSIAERRADRHDRAVGGSRGAERRPEGHAGAQGLARREQMAARRQVRSARSHPQVRAVHDAGGRAGCLVATGDRDRAH